ncbi:hypothetical protein niasHT_012976 [Heterodera trifolii]|uniref:Galectin domain-containing protein n=1 Tax=Heterodera trifolii TaxID=157864 RepID=A0ABD2L3S7_9BILA
MKSYLLSLILNVCFLANFAEGFTSHKPLITDRNNGLHLFNVFNHCPAKNDSSGHQLYLKIEQGFCEKGLLICYPSQWSGTKEGKIVPRLVPNFGKKYRKIQGRCEELKKDCTEFGGKENCGTSAQKKWHGILLKTKGSTVLGGIALTLSSSFLGEKYHLGNVTGKKHQSFIVELEHRQANLSYLNEFNAHISSGAFLHEFKSLALLGLDIMPHIKRETLLHGKVVNLELFVNRTCGCTLKAWFINPADDIRKIEWGNMEHGNKKCDTEPKRMSLKYKLDALKPFNESCEIVVEGQIGKNLSRITITLAKDWGELSWIKYIGLIADSIISKGSDAKEQEEEWRRYRSDNKLFQIILRENGTTLWAQGNISRHYSHPKKHMFLKKDGKLKISIYLKRFAYTCKINDQLFEYDLRPAFWFDRLPYAHMDFIQIKGDFVPVKPIQLFIHNQNKNTKRIPTPYYMKLNRAVAENTTFTLQGELHPNAQYLRVSFLYNAHDRNVVVGDTVYEICANFSRGLVNFRSYPNDFFGTRNSQSDIQMPKGGEYVGKEGSVPMFERTSYLSLAGDSGFEIFVNFTNDVFYTLVNRKHIHYVRKNQTKRWPLWKITNVAVSGDANLFEEPYFIHTRPYDIGLHMERNSKDNFVKRLDMKLLPGHIIEIKGKLTKSLDENLPITISLLTFCPLQLVFFWNSSSAVQLNVFALNGIEKIDILTYIDLPQFPHTAGKEIKLWIHIAHTKYLLIGDGRLSEDILFGDEEKRALPPWLVEFIHINAPLDLDVDYPKINKNQTLTYLNSNPWPHIMELKNRLQVGDKVIISADMIYKNEYEMFEMGFYTSGWSYTRPYSRIQFNVRFFYKSGEFEMYTDFWNWKTMLYKQWLTFFYLSDFRPKTRNNKQFKLTLVIIDENEYAIAVESDIFVRRFKFGDVKGGCERCMDTLNLDTVQQSWAMPIWTADYVVIKNYLTNIEIKITNKEGKSVQSSTIEKP